MMGEVLYLDNVSFSYDSKSNVVPIFDDFSMSINRGEFVSIVGASGCGKTTLLKICGGLLLPKQGVLKGGGVHTASYVFQEPRLLPWKSLKDNILLPNKINPTNGGSYGSILSMVGLQEYEHMYPGELSGGMQQRVAIARALLQSPSLLLMDEPFSALDHHRRFALNLELLKIFDSLQLSVLFVTHSVEEAVFLSDRIIVLPGNSSHPKKEVVIDLPRPRSLEVRNSEEYRHLVQCIQKEISGFI